MNKVKEITREQITSWDNLRDSLKQNMFVKCIETQLKNYIVNNLFITHYKDILGKWVSKGEISEDAIKYLIDNYYFDFDIWNSIPGKNTDFMANDYFYSKYKNEIESIIEKLSSVSFKFLKYYMDKCYDPQTLLKKYHGTESIKDELIKYSESFGESILRDSEIRKSITDENSDIFKRIFLDKDKINLYLFTDTLSRSNISVDICKKLLSKEIVHGEKETDDRIKEKLINIIERYPASISGEVFSYFGDTSASYDRDILSKLLSINPSEEQLMRLHKSFVSAGLYYDLYNYAEEQDFSNLLVLLKINDEN